MATHQAATAPANLLASTRLNAPIKVGSPFNVERRIRADGNPRRTLRSIFSVRAPSINDQARVIAPPTITASGLKPTIRFEIPMPRPAHRCRRSYDQIRLPLRALRDRPARQK